MSGILVQTIIVINSLFGASLALEGWSPRAGPARPSAGRDRIGRSLERHLAVNDGPEHLAAEPIVVIEGLVHALAVVPEHQGVRLPLQPTAEFFLDHMAPEKIEQGACLGFGHALDADTIGLVD